jgi:hypothetical protein
MLFLLSSLLSLGKKGNPNGFEAGERLFQRGIAIFVGWAEYQVLFHILLPEVGAVGRAIHDKIKLASEEHSFMPTVMTILFAISL